MTGSGTERSPSPLKLLWATALAIFAAEAAIMAIFSFLAPVPTLLEGALDALALTILVAPVLHRIWVRSLARALDDQARPAEISLPPLSPPMRLRESLQALRAVRPPATRSDAPS
jgi:hypothetical protein